MSELATPLRLVDCVREVLDAPRPATQVLNTLQAAAFGCGLADGSDLDVMDAIAVGLADGVVKCHTQGVAVPQATREYLMGLGLAADYAAGLIDRGLLATC